MTTLPIEPTCPMTDPPAWPALAVKGVSEVVQRAARKVSFKYGVDFADLEQHGRLAVATTPDLLECLDPTRGLALGLLHYRLERDLMNFAARELTIRDRHVSYEHRYDESVDGDVSRRPATLIAAREDVALYDRGLVELLLPAVWDDLYCWSSRSDNAADRDMPRGTIDKATGGTLAAHIADIRRAWDRCDRLERSHRRALAGVYGLDWTQRDVAAVLGVGKSTVGDWTRAGVEMIVGWLNGTTELNGADGQSQAA